MDSRLRPARRADQPEIIRLVRAARLLPFGLDWDHFLVAEAQGRIVGAGQIKAHCDGSHEIASLVVLEAYRRSGVGSLLVQALMRQADCPIYLICPGHLEQYYARFGFRRASPMQLTAYFWAVAGIIRLVGLLRRLRGYRREVRILCCVSRPTPKHEAG